MLEYSPFDKPLGELAPADLAALRTAAEGWYVEYKREIPNAGSIAKSVSAFANQYGGWLFYGVAEAGNRTRTAGAFPGVPSAEIPAGEQRVRDAVRTMMHPAAFFEVRALHGPCAEVGLAEGRAVLAVRVPEGANSPYVHGSGRVYRRLADASDPREVTDRNTLDTLFARSRERGARLTRLLETPLGLSRTEAEEPYCHLFLVPDPLGDRGVAPTVTFDAFAEVMTRAPTGAPALAFDNLFPSAHGYVARQVYGNDPQAKVLTWEYRLDGASMIALPLRRGLPAAPGVYRHQARFARLCRPSQAERVVDLNLLANLLAACVGTHRRLCRAFGVPLRGWGKARLVNVWRSVPYLDTAAYVDFVERYRTPTVQGSDVFAPPGTAADTLVLLEGAPEDETDDPNHIRPAMAVAKEIFYALGVPIVAIGSPQEFLEAGVRGAAAAGGAAGPPSSRA